MEETTKQLLTTIAENQPKIKELGYNEGFSAGKKAEYDEFWDEFQVKGNRVYYYHGFYVGPIGSSKTFVWTDKTFRPKYDIKPEGRVDNMFYGCGFTDLKGILEKQGIVLDMSEATTGASGLFGECFYLTRLPILNVAKIPTLPTAFSYCYKLVSIDKLILSESGNQTFSSTFNQCGSLQHITIEGVIGRNISFSYSPLTVESMKSVITHLKDYSPDTANHYAYTVTFKSTAFAELEAEGNTSPNGNTWTEYIDDLKWNLTLA